VKPATFTTARRLAAFLVGLALVAVGVLLLRALWQLHLPYVNMVLGLGVGSLVLILALLTAWKVMRALLYKVGRRLAFSYFLLGGLPIPMMLLLLGVVAYLLSSFFIGHLYRDALKSLDAEAAAATRERAAWYLRTGRLPNLPAGAGQLPGMVYAYYRDGRRAAGDPRAPERWPAWVAAAPSTAATLQPAPPSLASLPRFYSGPIGCPTLAATAGSAKLGVLGVYVGEGGDLDLDLSRRSSLWVETNRPGDPVDVVRIKLFSHELPLLALRRARQLGEAQKFFKQRSQGDTFWDRDLLWWGQSSGPLLDLASGRPITGSLLVTLNGTPRTVKQHLFAANGEIDAASWALLAGLAVLLANVYVAAALMAIYMIVGLSRAVNRLSRATDAVRHGDFGARIPVERRDQVGELQRSFNEMATNLQTLVAASTQKELLEKELALARDLQNSLIPSDLPSGEGVEFATLFEPSAAIGGDYFDVLRLSERELAVIIADVSGHGLSTGLRMAMLKAALLILIEHTRQPEEILRRLDRVVRSNAEGRCFVTATLAVFDLREGRLTLTNAGHPPTYVLHGGRVDEVLLPSSPLGGLGQSYARRELTLDRGDVVVWLSDGVFEEANAAGEPFGYDRIEVALAQAARAAGVTAAGPGMAPAGTGKAAGPSGAPGAPGPRGRRGGRTEAAAAEPPSAAAVRDRLLAAVAAHVGTRPPSDDRTVVVMRWGGPAVVPAATAAQEEEAVTA
jgi:HAMP domain-containing protein